MSKKYPDEDDRRVPPPPKSSSFLRNFLTAVHYLQAIEGYTNGVSTSDIECYMCRHYPMDGDIRSQVTWAINQAISYGFLQEKNSSFFLMYAMAKIYLTPQEREKQQEMSYAKRLFRSRWRCCCRPPPSKRMKPCTIIEPIECPKKRCAPFSECENESKKSKPETQCNAPVSNITQDYCPPNQQKSEPKCKGPCKPKSKRSTRSKKTCSYEACRGKSGVCDCNNH